MSPLDFGGSLREIKGYRSVALIDFHFARVLWLRKPGSEGDNLPLTRRFLHQFDALGDILFTTSFAHLVEEILQI